MKLMMKWAAAVAMATVWVAGAAAQSASSSAEEMLAAINAVKAPVLTREIANDPAKYKAFRDEVTKANEERNERILAFYKAYPEHEQTPALLNRRWMSLKPLQQPLPKETADFIVADVDAITANAPNEAIAAVGDYTRSYVRLLEAFGDTAKMNEAAEGFISKHRGDERGAVLLYTITNAVKSDEDRLAAYRRLVDEYPTHRYSKYAVGKIRQVNELGKPFELKFTDAVTGKPVSMADYKGKVVVLDFWATWCGPCIAELPKMKKLYADYKDKGLEIIGISLDQPEDKGGLTKLKEFVAKENMSWAHYYQGNFWDSEFSVSWGINAIPALFLIDQNGNLVDVEARAGLEDRVKKLLDK
jgi:thiol-disulfide isomerase/thioredoxin